MAKCLKKNYSKLACSGYLQTAIKNTKLEEANKVDDFIERFKIAIKGASTTAGFAINQAQTNKEDGYADSVDNLIEDTIKYANEILSEENNPKREKVPGQTGNGKSQVEKALKKWLMREGIPSEEEDMIKAVVKNAVGDENFDEDYEVQELPEGSIALITTVDKFFGEYSCLENYREGEFGAQMVMMSIVNPDGVEINGIKKQLVSSPYELNVSIAEYLKGQYSIVYNFVKELPGVGQGIGSRMFNKDGTISNGYYVTMDVLYNYLINQNNLPSLLFEQYYYDYTGEQDTSDLYKAVIAFMNLHFFEDTLRKQAKGYIQINTKVKSVDPQASAVAFRYGKNAKNNLSRPRFGQETRDQLKETGSFVKLLVNFIPVYNYSTKQKTHNRMTLKEFCGSLTKLIDITSSDLTTLASIKIDSAKNFVSASQSLDFEKRLVGVLDAIFNTSDNKKLLEWLKKRGVSTNDINYLYSIYHTVFDGNNKKSYRRIQNDHILQDGIPCTEYGIYDTIFGYINSTVSMKYLESKFDYKDMQMKTSVKEKYVLNSFVFGQANAINSYTMLRKDRTEFINKYKMKYDSVTQSWTVTIPVGNAQLTVTIEGEAGNILGKGETKSFTIKEIDNLESIMFHEHDGKKSEVNFSKEINRRKFIQQTEALTENEKKLKAVLEFIGSAINMRFDNDENLKQLWTVLSGNQGDLKKMFLIASRVLVISNIYDSFDKYRQTEEGKKYSQKNLFEYLYQVFSQSNNPYPPFRFIYKSPNFFDKDQRRKEEIEYVVRAQPYGFGLSVIRANDTAGDASWLLHWSQVRAMMNGSMSKATINDLSGNPMPNFSPWFLGYAAKEQAARIKQDQNSNMKSLMFIQDTDLITGVVINEDIKLQSGLSIAVKDMTDKELLYDRFMNKFIIPFLKDGTIYLQPTVLADKTKLVTYAINFKKIINGKTNHRQNVIEEFGKTLKPFYLGVWNKVLDDLDKLFSIIDNDYAADKTSDKAQKIQKKLQTMTEDDMSSALIQYKNKNNGNLDLEIENEVHYRVTNGKLSLNELLYSYATDYFEEEGFGIRLNSEMEKFFNDILINNPGFKSRNEENDPILKILEKFSTKKEDWISGNDMVIAIIRNADSSIAEKRIYGKIDKNTLQKGQTIEYNPVLQLYFLYNSLLSNNLRLCITGSEIGHKVTGYDSLVNSMKQDVSSYFSTDQPNTFFDFDLKIQQQQIKVNSLANKTSDDFNKENEILTQLKKIKQKYIDKISSRANNTQYKRQVIIPGTMRRFLNDRLNGITKQYKIVVTQDVKANVFNSFEQSKIDAHDGSAWLLPFTSILENNALQDNEASWTKKPIMHFMNSSTGCATLLKFATNTITNQIMRDAIGNENGLPMYNIFKKMCNIRWNGKILLTTVPEWKDEFNFESDILEKIKDGIELYYQDGNKFFRIVDFGYDKKNKVYYTKENEVSYITGNRLEKVAQKTVYHYFNENGDHTRSEQILSDDSLHTIDSLFELHKAMGGIYSVQRGSDGQLMSNGGSVNYSENSNYVVAQFMNSVTTVKQEYKDDIINGEKFVPITQETHEQPLKDMCYNMWANLTAVKNGAANINSVKSLYNDDPFLYMVVNTLVYGLQQDSDHVADEATMSEFTQVISALVAGGRNHEYIKQIYQQLGKVAIDAAEEELNAIEEFRNTGDKSNLYDMVGRAIVVDVLRGNREQKGLTTAIMKAIHKKFGRNANHVDDKYKIPFSDINIYSRLLPIISNIINKKSIKRRYPGLGTVMSPGYNIEMIYDIDGRTMKFEDILRESLNDKTITSNETDLVKKNNDRVKQYLQKRQNEIIKRDRDDKIKAIKDAAAKRLLPTKKTGKRDYETATSNQKSQIDKDQQVINQITWARNYSIESVDPTDNVYITYKENGVEKVLHVSLDDILTYYNFKVMGKDGSYDLRHFIAKHANISDQTTISDWWVFRDVTRPRNLAPSKISWDYYEGEGDDKHVRHMNLYDHPSISKNFDSSTKDAVLKRKQNTQALYDDLSKGQFTLNGKTYQIFNFKSQAFECITSNMYKSKFGIQNQDTLDYINQQGEKYFEDKNHTLITTDTYDMAFTRADGEHLYITFDPVIKEADNESFNFRKNAWKNIKREKMVHDQRVNKDNYKTHERMFAIDEDNMKMFEIARNIYRDDVMYDDKTKKFKITKKNKKGKKEEEVILDNQWKYKLITENGEQRVIEYVEFVSRYTVYEQGEKYTLYRINHNAIRRCLEQPEYTPNEINNIKQKYNIKEDNAAKANLFNGQVNDYLANLLMDIYNQVDYTGIQINGDSNTMSVNSHNILTVILPRINRRLDTNPELQEYLKYLIECNKDATEQKAKDKDSKEYTTGYKYKVKKYKLVNYFKQLQHKKFVSFQKAQTFTVGRIPGQSMQSFMQMKNVAFTGVDIGQVFVSHWQTW